MPKTTKYDALIVAHSIASKTDRAALKFLHPRYWMVWLGIGLLKASTWLPWRVQMAFGKALGTGLYHLLKERRRISCINLRMAFPDLTPAERKHLNRRHFISLLQGFFEAALSWWGSDKKLRSLLRVEGGRHFSAALQQDKGILLLSAHFTSLELGGRLLTLAYPDVPLHVVYRPHQNALIENLVANIRSRRYGKAIPKNRIRDMIKSLRGGFPLWYAQDQSYRGKNSVIVPFFGVPTATNSATSRFAKLSGATVIPFFTVRRPDGYLLKFLPPLADFPGDDIIADTQRINRLLEEQIHACPEQYLWTHKRFKSDATDVYHNSEIPGECQ